MVRHILLVRDKTLGFFLSDSSTYYMLLGLVVLMVAFGFVMVLSSSSVESKIEDGGFFEQSLRQGVFALIGVPVLYVASRLPERLWMKAAWPSMILSCIMQLLVVFTPLGIEVGGNTNWLALGPVQFQPSEAIKVSMVLWLGLIVSRKQHVLNDLKQGLVPVLVTGGGAIGLVLLGGDLGTVMVMAGMLFGALFLIGVRLRTLAIPVSAGLLLFTVFALTSESRMRRIASFLTDCTQSNSDDCWQIQHGTWALANGGIFGVGLGNSTAKWSWLPAADNDFIFAIIGEELGILGATLVLALFAVLAVLLYRAMANATTPYGTAASAVVLVWVVGQAAVNIAVVLGVMPILGVPLPLISAGGTALLTTMFAIGVAMSFARTATPEQELR
ncbi:putative lipid II flippase FtsW [Agromyces humi]|uniref:putative lipid II flippase FtsW n=1 Tax=Agromyces humi TaxID=1766800 RepID=UPI00135A5933|nr:putative lipid II flippase FtsW [Agromyces humi]